MLPLIIVAVVLWWAFRRRQLQVMVEDNLPHRPSSPSPAVSSSQVIAPHSQGSSSLHDHPTESKTQGAPPQTPHARPLNSGEERASQLKRASQNPLVLLSIDGGRWETLSPISQIEILGNILSSYEFDNDLEEDSIRIGDIFDLIVGTGTGALVACMLVVLKMTADEATKAYLQLYKSAFEQTECKTPEQRIYDLRRGLQNLLDSRDREGKGLDMRLSAMNIRDLGNSCGKSKLAVTAMHAHNVSGGVLFRTYRGRNPSPQCSLLETLLATLADAESFPVITLTQSDIEEKYISASFGRCNPIHDALIEVGSIFKQDSIASIVSIGAGRPKPIAVNEPETFTEAARGRLKDCQSVSDDMERRFSRHNNLYARFEVDIVDLAAGQAAPEIIAHSRAYLRKDEIRNRLNVLICSLTNRPSRLKVSQLSGLEPGAVEQVLDVVKFAGEIAFLASLDKLEVSLDAPYNSATARLLRRRMCTPNTRVNILQKIMLWAKENSHLMVSSLFWLFGLAGTGKSTIVQSICERLDEEGLLASSYFCSIQLDSKDSKRIVPTIARHLATRFPGFAKHLASKLREDPGCASARIHDQFRHLLCAPWSLFGKEHAHQRSFVVVIDALDECDDGEEVLGLILDAIDHNQLQGIRFFAASRPVPRFVTRALELSRGPQVALHEVKKEDVSGDIRLFLEEQLHDKVEPATIQKLTARADGLFIFASTLVKHVMPNSKFMTGSEIREKLRQILLPREGEEVGLDALYDRILRDTFSLEELGNDGFKLRLLVLQTVVSTEQATTADVIADLLNYDVGDVIGIVNSLHSVLFTRGLGEPIYVIHASFRDFVVSRAQGLFKCDLPSIHLGLSKACLGGMEEKLKFNICDIESSFTINSDILPPPFKSIGETLAYACRHWWAHVTRCTPGGQEGIQKRIGEMMETKGLFWIEVMTLLGDERRSQNILTEISETSSMAFEPGAKQGGWKLQSLAREAAGMVSTFRTITPKRTSHLYLSVLSLWDGKHLEPWSSQFRRLPRVLSRKVDGSRNTKLIINVEALSVAFSPDGKRVISGSHDRSMRIWDAESGTQVGKLDGHGNSVRSVAFSPDGKRVVSGSDDNSVRIWDANSGKQVGMLDGHGSSVLSVGFSPDGKCVVSGSSDKSVRIWDAESGEQIGKLGCHISSVSSVAFSPDGRRVVSGSHDNSMRIWDTVSSEQASKLDGHSDLVLSVAFSPSGKHVVSGSDDESVRIWDAESGKQVGRLDGHGDSVRSVAFSPDGKHIVSGSDDNSVRIWDAESGKQIGKLDGHGDSVLSVAFSPSGARVVSSSSDKSMRIWDAEYGQQIGTLDGHEGSVWSIAFSPDGRRVVSGSSDKSVRIWDAESGKQVGKLDGHGSLIRSVAFSPDGKYVVSGSDDESVRIWNAESGKQVGKLNGHGDLVRSVAFSPDGKLVMSSSSDRSVRIWDAESGKQVGKLDGHRNSVLSAAFSPDGKKIVSSSSDKSVRIWKRSGQQVGKLDGHEDSVLSVNFSPNGKLVISGSHDNSIRIWDAESGEQVGKLNGHRDSVLSVTFSHDGNRVASGSSDKSVRIWDAESGEQVGKLDGHGDSVLSVAFSPNGKHIVSGSHDNSIRIWDAESGKQLFDFENAINSVSFQTLSAPTSPHVGHLDNSYSVADHASIIVVPTMLSQRSPTDCHTLYLGPTCTSFYTREDGWVVTSKEQTHAELPLIWLPPSLRPYNPPVLTVMSTEGFNRIDMNGCTFGDMWSTSFIEETDILGSSSMPDILGTN
ncbi:WD40-repeat-containing domain protein [Flagelloscypha sp. PMI_526]|nr:WD40-repeat-containing domain protein [Flagelloscypha sp. PMI_526]